LENRIGAKQIEVTRIGVQWISVLFTIEEFRKMVVQCGLFLPIDLRQMPMVLFRFLYLAVPQDHPQKKRNGQNRPTQRQTPVLLGQKNDQSNGKNEVQQAPQGEQVVAFFQLIGRLPKVFLSFLIIHIANIRWKKLFLTRYEYKSTK
jgi:hypothetical protein